MPVEGKLVDFLGVTKEATLNALTAQGLYPVLLNGTTGALQDTRGTPVSSGGNPAFTTYKSGSGTFTTPVGCKYIEVEFVAGGGGGCGSGTTPGLGGDGSDTTFGALTAHHGSKGIIPVDANNNGGGLGGTGTDGDVNISGGNGSGIGFNNQTFGNAGAGGNTPFGFNAAPSIGAAAIDPPANSGCGGGGGYSAATANIGGGGGAGQTVRKRIVFPAATYAYSVGAGGTAGTAGTGGFAGRAGAAGQINIYAFT